MQPRYVVFEQRDAAGNLFPRYFHQDSNGQWVEYGKPTNQYGEPLPPLNGIPLGEVAHLYWQMEEVAEARLLLVERELMVHP